MKSPHISHRVVFDIGSGTVKMQSAWIDESSSRILEKTGNFSCWLPISDFIAEHPEKEISKDVLEMIIFALLEGKKKSCLQGVFSLYFGVATEAFRLAKNGKEALALIEKKTGISLRCISHEEEALLGRKALCVEGYFHPEEDFIAWENGGGSLQITAQSKVDREVFCFMKKIGKIPFKNHVIENIQRKKKNLAVSPNPISEEDAHKAIEWLAFELQTIPSWLSLGLESLEGKVIGFGGMFPCIQNSLGKSDFTKEDVRLFLNALIAKTDEDLKGNEPTTFQVLDPLFLYAVMDILKIKSVSYKSLIGSTSALLVSKSIH